MQVLSAVAVAAEMSARGSLRSYTPCENSDQGRSKYEIVAVVRARARPAHEKPA